MRISTFLCSLLILFLLSCKKTNDTQSVTISENKRIFEVENGLLPKSYQEGDSILPFTLNHAMVENKVPGVGIAVIENGRIDWAKGYGWANAEQKIKVDTTTLFQAASISKPITALAILKLMEAGKVHLDSNVNTYLKTWKAPENEFTKTEKVTLRRLLTHSAGTTVHGFPGYKNPDSIPTTSQVLLGDGNTAKVVVDTIPGSRFKYSGGGYTIVQKVIEDVTESAFETYMDEMVLPELNMIHSTFAQPLPKEKHEHASAAYDDEGLVIEGLWNTYPEKAAAGLWTTPSDLARYIIAMQEIKAGKKDGFLSSQTVTEMLSMGKFDHGLGPGVVHENNNFLFVHGGKNAGFTNLFVAYINEEKGLVIMTNADNGGRLLGAIERAVSKVYNWGLSEPKAIKTISLSEPYLTNFVGTYTYVEQVPSVGGDYVVKAKITNGNLVIFDVPEEKEYHFVATDSLEFLDINNGDRVSFKRKNNEFVLWWNNSFEFQKNK